MSLAFSQQCTMVSTKKGCRERKSPWAIRRLPQPDQLGNIKSSSSYVLFPSRYPSSHSLPFLRFVYLTYETWTTAIFVDVTLPCSWHAPDCHSFTHLPYLDMLKTRYQYFCMNPFARLLRRPHHSFTCCQNEGRRGGEKREHAAWLIPCSESGSQSCLPVRFSMHIN